MNLSILFNFFPMAGSRCSLRFGYPFDQVGNYLRALIITGFLVFIGEEGAEEYIYFLYLPVDKLIKKLAVIRINWIGTNLSLTMVGIGLGLLCLALKRDGKVV